MSMENLKLFNSKYTWCVSIMKLKVNLTTGYNLYYSVQYIIVQKEKKLVSI